MHITIGNEKHALLNIIFDFNDATLFDIDLKKRCKESVWDYETFNIVNTLALSIYS